MEGSYYVAIVEMICIEKSSSSNKNPGEVSQCIEVLAWREAYKETAAVTEKGCALKRSLAAAPKDLLD